MESKVEFIEQEAQFHRTVFIFNPRSGKIGFKRGIIRLIDRIWGASPRRYSILVTTRPGEGERLAREEVTRGAELVVAVGGDGTLNEIVRGMIGSKACVGLIPAGSGNGFARHWKLPLEVTAACRGLMEPKLVKCDVGLADQHLFLVTFGCGVDALISQNYARSMVRGIPSYFFHGVRSVLTYKSQPTKVQLNGNILYSGLPLLLTIANTRGYGGGTIIAPQAQADDGLLDFCAFDSRSLRSSIIGLHNIFNGKVHKVTGYHHQLVREVVIEREQPSAAHVDGDPFQATPEIRVKTLPQALTFALPA